MQVTCGDNVCVDSVPGFGKTTTNLYLSLNNPTKHMLLLTYNAKLKLETRQKVQALGINNLEVHSYHSFCVKYFNSQAYTDNGILAHLTGGEGLGPALRAPTPLPPCPPFPLRGS